MTDPLSAQLPLTDVKTNLSVVSRRSSAAGAHAETAVKHAQYGGGEEIVVQTYATDAEAVIGHARWLSALSGRQLPDLLVDVSISAAAINRDQREGNGWRKKVRTRA